MKLFQLAAAALICASTHGGVVINEIFYNAPGELEDLEYVELHNAADAAADISGWALSKGVKFKFQPGTTIAPRDFLVLCRNAERFQQFYRARVAGTFKEKLKNSGEQIVLSDASGTLVDQVSYSDQPPWPSGADGVSGSLERICPAAGGNDPSNWSSSPLSPDRTRPGGTPGEANASYSAELPPVISDVAISPAAPLPGQAITITAAVRGTNGTERVTLLYRSLSGAESSVETSVRMTETSPGKFSAAIPGSLGDRLLRYRVGVRGSSGATRIFPSPNEPAPALSVYIANTPPASAIPQAFVFAQAGAEYNPQPRRWRGPRQREPEPVAPSFQSALVYYDPEFKKFEVFDFVQSASRPGGWKVHLGKNQSLREMTTLNIAFETDRGVLAEPLAYEVYRLCGMAAPLSWHVRLTINGNPLGYHLLFEQPNRAFLRRNKIRDDGNLYKILWYEHGVVAQHEKKTNVHQGHQDVVALIKALESTQGDAQWEVIKKNFDMKQVATYFAVNTVLSHWDGFFNNYFTYHDVKGSGKWTMYPWDQDQTWGILNGQPGYVFYEMPLTFGMAGDVPPGGGGARRRQTGGDRFAFGHGPMWWRPGGYFSSPLLANPRFRELFLARTREILETTYTPEKINPLIEQTQAKLREEVKFKAQLNRMDPKDAFQEFERNIRAFKTHLLKRREFLLDQPDIKNSSISYGGRR